MAGGYWSGGDIDGGSRPRNTGQAVQKAQPPAGRGSDPRHMPRGRGRCRMTRFTVAARPSSSVQSPPCSPFCVVAAQPPHWSGGIREVAPLHGNRQAPGGIGSRPPARMRAPEPGGGHRALLSGSPGQPGWRVPPLRALPH
eukprot:gene4387-biopygen7445